jgi:hypothetical protein
MKIRFDEKVEDVRTFNDLKVGDIFIVDLPNYKDLIFMKEEKCFKNNVLQEAICLGSTIENNKDFSGRHSDTYNIYNDTPVIKLYAELIVRM